MRYLIRAALMALSVATITPVANAAGWSSAAATIQQDSAASWANG